MSSLPLLAGGIATAFGATFLGSKALKSDSAAPEGKVKYGVWRTDQPTQDGYSPELISVDSYKLIEGAKTDLEELESLPRPGCDTIFKAI